MRLLNTASRLGLANTLADTNACGAIFYANILRVGLICVLGRRTTRTLGERRARRSRVALTKTHKALDSLPTVQLWVLAVLARPKVVYPLCVIVLRRVVLVSEIVVGRRGELVLLTVKSTTIMVRLGLHRAGALLASWGRCCALSGRTGLEHGGILDERLWNTVARVVWRTIVLILRVGVVVGDRRRVVLLRALATGWLRLCAALGRQLGRLGV